MAAPRRTTDKSSETRSKLLDAAEQIMMEDGYGAVTSRSVEKRAGITSQLVHYYFGSMDNLFVELSRRRSEGGLNEFERFVDSDDLTFRALWEAQSQVAAAGEIELVALANHHKAVRDVIAEHGRRFRVLHNRAVAKLLARHGVSPEDYPPEAITMVMTGLAQLMTIENTIGLDEGHDAANEFADRLLERFRSAAPDDTDM